MPEEQSAFLVSIIFCIRFHVGKFTVFFYGECNVILHACANSEYQATLRGGEWPGDEASSPPPPTPDEPGNMANPVHVVYRLFQLSISH